MAEEKRIEEMQRKLEKAKENGKQLKELEARLESEAKKQAAEESRIDEMQRKLDQTKEKGKKLKELEARLESEAKKQEAKEKRIDELKRKEEQTKEKGKQVKELEARIESEAKKQEIEERKIEELQRKLEQKKEKGKQLKEKEKELAQAAKENENSEKMIENDKDKGEGKHIEIRDQKVENFKWERETTELRMLAKVAKPNRKFQEELREHLEGGKRMRMLPDATSKIEISTFDIVSAKLFKGARDLERSGTCALDMALEKRMEEWLMEICETDEDLSPIANDTEMMAEIANLTKFVKQLMDFASSPCSDDSWVSFRGMDYQLAKMIGKKGGTKKEEKGKKSKWQEYEGYKGFTAAQWQKYLEMDQKEKETKNVDEMKEKKKKFDYWDPSASPEAIARQQFEDRLLSDESVEEKLENMAKKEKRLFVVANIRIVPLFKEYMKEGGDAQLMISKVVTKMEIT